jgi:hypothetical protein
MATMATIGFGDGLATTRSMQETETMKSTVKTGTMSSSSAKGSIALKVV